MTDEEKARIRKFADEVPALIQGLPGTAKKLAKKVKEAQRFHALLAKKYPKQEA